MNIFLGGNVSRNEFRTIERDVRLAAARFDAEIRAFESLATAPTRLPDVDFFVLCRSFPNEFSPADVERLRRAAPLAPIALVAGVLCEGENRTDATFPGTRRFYVGSWRESGRREFFRFFSESAGLFAAFPAATNVDVLAATSTNGANATTAPRELVGATIAIFSDADPALGRFLCELFAERGADVRRESTARFAPPSERAPDRIVVDSLDLAAPGFVDELRAIRAQYPTSPLDLLAFSPRVDELERFENAAVWGPVRVLSKPFDVDFLLNAPEERAADAKSASFRRPNDFF